MGPISREIEFQHQKVNMRRKKQETFQDNIIKQDMGNISNKMPRGKVLCASERWQALH